MSSTAAQRVSIVTPTDHGALVSVAVYFLMTVFLVSVAIRLVIRLAITRSLSIDDHIASGASILGIAQSIAVVLGIRDGLGKKEDLLSHSQVMGVQKAQYASDILYLVTLCLAKVSILLLLQRLAVSRLHKRIALGTIAIVGLWTLTGIITLAAQCGSSLPWTTSSTTGHCISIRGFWIGMAPVDILTELVVVAIPILMMMPVQVALAKKIVIVVAFVFRVLVIAATIVRLFYIEPATSTSPDATFTAVNYNIVTQVVLSISIMTACIPCLKPFLDGFDSGMMAVSFKDRMPTTGGNSHSHSNPRNYAMRDLAYTHGSSGNPRSMNLASALRSQNHEKDFACSSDDDASAITTTNTPNNPRQKMGVSVEVVSQPSHHQQQNRDSSPRRHNRENNGSIASSSKSDQMIIKKNIQWTVQYEDAAPPPPPSAPPALGRTDRSVSRRHSGAMRDEGEAPEAAVHAV